MQITIGVEKSLIAGTEPSIYKGMRIGVGIIFIAAKYIRSLNCNLAPLVGPQMIPIFVHDADPESRTNPHRTSLAVTRRQGIRRHLMGRFRHAIRFHERYAEYAFNLIDEFRRQRRATGAQEAKGSRFRR